MSVDSTSRRHHVPEKPTVDGLEALWTARWDDEGTYRFNPEATRENVYSIDTPPPTVSGELHIGHVFSYTQGDVVARFWRMRGRDVFYPMGWDDNGLPTERRVENFYGVRCDPTLPYDPGFVPPEKPAEKKLSISRQNFVELCQLLTALDEVAFKNLWRHLGISVDWSLEYTTISPLARAVSQRGVLGEPRARRGLLQRGADPLGHRLSNRRLPGRARGPRTSGHLPPRRLRALRRPWHDRDRDHASRDAGELRRAGGPSRGRALPRPLGIERPHASLSRRGPDSGSRTGRSRQRIRHRHDLHVR